MGNQEAELGASLFSFDDDESVLSSAPLQDRGRLPAPVTKGNRKWMGSGQTSLIGESLKTQPHELAQNLERELILQVSQCPESPESRVRCRTWCYRPRTILEGVPSPSKISRVQGRKYLTVDSCTSTLSIKNWQST